MAPLKFYADLRSQPCRAVYIFMKVNNIPFETIKIDLFSGDQLGPDFTKVSSIQRVPVIDDDGFILGESGAIFRYLARKYNVAEHWYPARDLQKQARIDEYLNWHHTNTRHSAMMTFRHQFINAVRGKPVKQDELNMVKMLLAKTVEHIDKYYLKDRRFIGGDDVSVADLQAVCELMQLDVLNQEGLYQGNAVVKAWVERVKARFQTHFDTCDNEGLAPMKSVYKQLSGSKL